MPGEGRHISKNSFYDLLPYLLWILGGITLLASIFQLLSRALSPKDLLPAFFLNTALAWYYLFMYYGFRIFWERRELYTVASVTARALGGCATIILLNELLTGIDKALVSIEAGFVISYLRIFILFSGVAWCLALLHKLVMVARKPFVDIFWTAFEVLVATGFLFLIIPYYIPLKIHLLWVALGLAVWTILSLQQKWIGLLGRDEHLLNAVLMALLLVVLSWLAYVFYRFMPLEMVGIFVLNVPVVLALGFCVVYVLVGFLALAFTFPYHTILRQKEAQFRTIVELILRSESEVQPERIFMEVLKAGIETTDSEGGLIEVEVPVLGINFSGSTGIRPAPDTLTQIKKNLLKTSPLEVNKRRAAPLPLPPSIGSLLCFRHPLESGHITLCLFKSYQYGYDLYMKERVQQLIHQLGFVLDYMIASHERRQAERIRHEMEVAREVQKSLLEIQAGQWQDHIAFIFEPALETSGDLYLVKVIHNSLHAIVADVVGKGMKAAMYMAVLRGALETALKGDRTLGERFRICSEAMREILSPGDFITLVWAIIHPQNNNTGLVEVLRAGHCPPFLFSQEGKSLWIEDGAGTPIGIDEPQIKPAIIPIKSGDWLIILSDGFIEGEVRLPNDDKPHILGYEGASQLLSNACKKSQKATEFPQILYEQLQHLNFKATDDLTVLACRY